MKDERKPKRPWSTQNDGDLWGTFCEIAKHKWPKSIIISKVKGHATDTNFEDGITTWKDKRGKDRADRAADEGVKNHSDEICKISRIQAQRQQGYILFIKNIHDHILEAFYKREYIENVELNKNEKDGQQQIVNPVTKHVQIGEIPYSQDLLRTDSRDLTCVGHGRNDVQVQERV